MINVLKINCGLLPTQQWTVVWSSHAVNMECVGAVLDEFITYEGQRKYKLKWSSQKCGGNFLGQNPKWPPMKN